MNNEEYTPDTEWIRIMVGYSMTTATDRTLSIEDARQKGYAWFDRWIETVIEEANKAGYEEGYINGSGRY